VSDPVHHNAECDAPSEGPEEGISAYPAPSQVDAVEALAYVMATLSGVVEAHLMNRLRTVWLYVREGRSDES